MKLPELKDRLKKKYVVQVIAGVLTICLLGTGMTYTARAAKDGENAANTVETETTKESDDSLKGLLSEVEVEQKEIGKSETVYFLSNPDGSIYHTIVSDHLINSDGADTLEDKSNLTDIENVKGEETFTQDGDKLTWQANGEDIYYQGTTTTEAPVSQTVTYYLDGTEISPVELAGKSGHVTIQFQYTNNTSYTEEVNGEKCTVVVPFAAMTAVMLDDNFTNVEISSNGRIENLASGTMVVGYALPGVIDSLQAEDGFFSEDLDVPESFTIEADVEDFTLNTAMTAVVNAGSLTDIKTGTDMSEIDDLIDTLSDASSQLEDGSKQLAEGLDTLKASLGDFSTGMATLNSGIIDYTTGASQVASGIETLNASLPSLTSGVSQLNTGITAIYENMAKLVSGSSDLKDGVATLQAGVESMGAQIGAAITNAADLKEKEATVGAVFDQLKASRVTADTYEAGVDAAVNTMVEANDVTIQAQVKAQVLTTSGHTSAEYDTWTAAEEAKNGVDSVVASAMAANPGLDEATARASVLATLGHTEAEYQAWTTAAAGKAQIDAAVAQYVAATKASLKEEKGAALKTDSLKAVYAAYLADTNATDATSFISGYAAGSTTALQTIQAGLPTLTTGISQLLTGATDLANGLDQLNTQAVVPVYKGFQTLNASLPTLTDGVSQLYTGTQTLVSNNDKLTSGSKQLVEGTAAVVAGVDQLESGSNELYDGMVQFNDEGIERIVNAYTGDIKPLSNKIQAMIDASDDYQTFTDIADGVNGNVKFIYKLGAISEEE